MAIRINITESDITSSVTSLSNTDIVFVPGMSIASGSDAVDPFVPKLCSSLADFKKYFGDTQPTFSAVINYPVVAGETTVGFPEKAVPGYSQSTQTIPMFTQGQGDPSWMYAKRLLELGLSVVYCRLNPAGSTTTSVDISTIYSGLSTVFSATSPLFDKGEYQIKYLTAGAYPVFEYSAPITSLMIGIAKGRGDCIALFDHTDNAARPLTGNDSVFAAVQSASIADGSYAAMFTPWGEFPTEGTSTLYLPGSFSYLASLASSLSSSTNWQVVAGVTRGVVPTLKSLHTNSILTNTIADVMQGYSADSSSQSYFINAITNVKPYGLCIWGNRTLNNNSGALTALSYLNLRNMVSDVKKQVYDACMTSVFEQNTASLWANFKAKITPLLDRIQSGSGIKGYKIIKDDSSAPTKLKVTIKLYPVYAVEAFDIGIVLTDESVEIN